MKKIGQIVVVVVMLTTTAIKGCAGNFTVVSFKVKHPKNQHAKKCIWQSRIAICSGY
jgi:hypothetical protein